MGLAENRLLQLKQVRKAFAGYEKWIDEDGDCQDIRLLLCPVRGQASFPNLVEGTVANAMRLRGAKVLEVACDKVLPVCDNMTFRSGDRKSICENCWENHHRFFDALGVPTIRLSQLVDEKAIQRAWEFAGSVPDDQLFEVESEGLPLGKLAESSTIHYFLRGRLLPEHASYARKFLVTALIQQKAIKALVERFDPNRVFTSHGIYTTWGVYAKKFLQLGISYHVHAMSYIRDRILITHKGHQFETLPYEDKKNWAGVELDDRKNEMLDQYMASKVNGSFDRLEVGFQPQDPVSFERFVNSLGLQKNKTVIGLFSNVVWDASINGISPLFKDMTDWIFQTIRWAQNRDDIELILRVHPAEVNHIWWATEERLTDEIRREFGSLPGHIHVIDADDPVSTYDLTGLLDAAVAFTSRVGLEFAVAGIPVITTARGFFSGKGFTFDADTIDDYYNLLKKAADLKNEMKQRTVKARRYAYHINFRRQIPFPVIQYMGPENPERLLIKSVTDLLPGKIPEVDLICNGILEKKEIIWDGPQVLPEPRLK